MASRCATRLLLAGILLLYALTATALWAQAEPPASSRRPAPAGSRTSAQAEDDARRAKILSGKLWKQVAAEYDQWLAVQVVYTPEQLREISARVQAEISSLPTDELEEFLRDTSAKLELALGPESSEAREWLGVYMTNMADGYRKKFLTGLGLGDPTRMSASDLETALFRLRAERISRQQNQAAFDRGRRESVQSIRQADAAAGQRQDRDRALRAMAGPAVAPSPYAPPKPVPPPPRMQFYVDGNGRVGYSLPW